MNYSSEDIYYSPDIKNIIDQYKEQMEKLEYKYRVRQHKVKFQCPLSELTTISDKVWFRYRKKLIYNVYLREGFYINLDEHTLLPSEVKKKSKDIKEYIELCYMY